MTPKEKAEQLLWKYLPLIEGWTSPEKTDLAKKLALVCVNEILFETPEEILDTWKGETNFVDNERFSFFQSVKAELEAL